MTDQPQPLDLDAIEARNEAYTAIHLNSGEFANCSAADSANDVPALVAEVRRLTAELATMTAVAESNKRYIQSMYQDLQRAQQQTETLAGIVALHLHTGWHLPKRTAEEKTRAKWAAGEANALAAALHAAEINVFDDHNPAAVSGA